MEQSMNVKFRVKLQKSSGHQKPVHEVKFEELSQAKEDTDLKVQDQNNVDLLFHRQSIIHFHCTRRDHCS
jgi:flagellar basal body rod protein FlgB